ncbi:hypothetical protein [Kribbella sp. NPDC004536]|uniref:hypothetical protein n=1 Tax=Kribbella sp. NPDC004536 TaxID=3364106 RepID=UPI0036B37CC5
MAERLGDSEWTVSQARDLVHNLRRVAPDGPEYDGIELFLALSEYLDELHGTDRDRGRYGFGSFYEDAALDELAAAVQAVRGPETAWDANSNRMDQPVNAAVTLAEGRELVDWLEGRREWERQLGLSLRALYAYLDQLYGGPGLFNQLLTPRERERVAAR